MDLEREKENLFLVVKRKQAHKHTHTSTLRFLKLYYSLEDDEKHISKLASASGNFAVD